jgi:hypothetical protein
MTPNEHLVDSAKLYDYGSNKDGSSTHTTRVHLSKFTSSYSSSTPAVYSAPLLMDLLNADNNVEPQDLDTAAMEEFWFNNPNPYYDLNETDCVDPVLQETIVRSSTRFDIANYVKLDDGKLTTLISKVDRAGPGASMTETPQVLTIRVTKPVIKPGEWRFLEFHMKITLRYLIVMLV